MTEQVPPLGPDDPDPEPAIGARDEVPGAPAEPTRTGVPTVDEVLADVDALDDRPLGEHLAAFERAHDALRSALDAEPGEPA